MSIEQYVHCTKSMQKEGELTESQ